MTNGLHLLKEAIHGLPCSQRPCRPTAHASEEGRAEVWEPYCYKRPSGDPWRVLVLRLETLWMDVRGLRHCQKPCRSSGPTLMLTVESWEATLAGINDCTVGKEGHRRLL